MSVANANIGAKILAFRVYGIDNYTFGAGPQGSQGLQGLQGLSNQGIQGIQGVQGPLSTFQGTQGTQGLQGIWGPATIPQSSSTVNILSTDNGKFIPITSDVTLTNVFGIGENVVIYNNTTSQLRIISSGTTLRLASTDLLGSRYIQQRGLATIICVASNDYVISGAGVT